jgi:DNA-binding response OmpR family regulator
LLEPYAPKGARAVLRGGVASRGAPLTRLGLDLDDPGFDASVLVEFRARLVAGGVEQRLLDTLPIVVCTASPGSLDGLAGREGEGPYVLAKPFDLDRLLAILATARRVPPPRAPAGWPGGADGPKTQSPPPEAAPGA